MSDKKSDKILNRAKKKQKRIHAKADKAINKRGGGQNYEKVEFDSNTRTGKVVDTRTKKEQKVSERVNTKRKEQVEKVRTRLKSKYEKAKQKEALAMNKVYMMDKDKKKKFKPHNMYCKDGSKHFAKTYQEHLKLKKKNCGHKKFKNGGKKNS